MKKSLPIIPPITCQYHHKGVCLEASRIVGAICNTVPAQCALSCRKWEGPYDGRTITSEQQIHWAAKMLNANWGGVINKVAANYTSKLEVHVPSCTEEVLAAFGHLLNLPWIKSISLTGSVLIAGMTPKDIDVYIVVTDLKTYVDERKALCLPSKIGDLPVDVFVSDQEQSFFMSLDLKTMKLYKSKLYNVSKVDPKITEVVETGKAVYVDKGVLADRTPLKTEVTPCSSCGRAKARRNKE